jgi:hypothetical protein
MNDDYDDPDEPGGLWDPDAFTPRPAPARPALHIVTTQRTAGQLDRPADATGASEKAEDHTLVRLEQFRPASDRQWPGASLTKRVVVRSAAAAAILANIIAATAVASIIVGAPQRPGGHAPSRHVGVVVSADTERAAATRQVASASSRVHNERPAAPRAQQRRTNRRRSVMASPKGAATSTQHAPTLSAPHAPATSTTTVVRPAASRTRPQTRVASARSEFGFEG